MDLKTLKTEVGRLAGRVDSSWATRIRSFINEAQKDWASKVPWPTLIKTEDIYATGNQTLVLPQRVLFVRSIADKTNKRPIYVNDQWDREYPTSYFSQTAGPPVFARERGVTPVTKQPTTGEALTVKTAQSDTCTVFVAGLAQDTTASGTPDEYYYTSETFSVTSDSEVAGSTLFTRIDTIGKDDFTVADIVVRNSSSDVIARIPARDLSSEYRQVQLLHVPPADTVLELSYINKPQPLVNDSDIPHPSIKPEFLVWHAAALMHYAQSQVDEARIKMARANEWVQQEIYKERGFGDRDWRIIPDMNYHNDEDFYDANEYYY